MLLGALGFKELLKKNTLMDNIIEKMQFRCFVVSASHSQTSQTYILTLKSSFYVA